MALVLYALAGVGAIVALTGYLISDAIELADETRFRHQPPRVWPRRWAAVSAILIVLWLTAMVLR